MQWKLVLNILCDLYKVLVGYFDPNRFPLLLGLSLDCGVVELVPVVLCTLANIPHPGLKLVTECQLLCVRLLGGIAYHHWYK